MVDGATGAILKRMDMPPADLTSSCTLRAARRSPRWADHPQSEQSVRRTNAAAPAAVQIGDMTGGGKGDFIVDASDFFETGATANPESNCATSTQFNAVPANNQCQQAGRGYMFTGESIAGSDPSVILNTPLYTVTNPAAQADDPNTPVNNNRENLGYSIAPVGDLGKCNIDPNGNAALGGDFCANSNSTGTPDGRPDIALSSHRTDDFGMMDAGVFLLLDGTNGSVLYEYHHPEPQPAALFAFSNYNQPAFGDLGHRPRRTSIRRPCARTTLSRVAARAT